MENRRSLRATLVALLLLPIATAFLLHGSSHDTDPVSVIPDDPPVATAEATATKAAAAVTATATASLAPYSTSIGDHASDTKPKATQTDLDHLTAANRAGNPPVVFRTVSARRSYVSVAKTIRTSNGFLIRWNGKGTRITPTVHGGVLLSGGDARRETMHAFDPKTGVEIWSLSLVDNGSSALACEGDLCAFTTESCTLYVIDVRHGVPRWSLWLADPLMGAPAVADGRVFAAYPTWDLDRGAGAGIAAFDLSSGGILWNKRIDEDVHATPVVSGTQLTLTTSSGSRFRFVTRSGTPIDATVGNPPPRIGVIDASPTAEGASYLVLRPRGQPASSRPLVLRDRTVQRRNSDVVASANGVTLWRARVSATTAPVLVAGDVFVGTADGTVVRIDRETGSTVKTWQIGSVVRAEPAIVDGWIYAPTDDGLVAIDTKDPALTGWSQWGGNATRTFLEH